MWPWSKQKVASPLAELREMLFDLLPRDRLAAPTIGAATALMQSLAAKAGAAR